MRSLPSAQKLWNDRSHSRKREIFPFVFRPTTQPHTLSPSVSPSFLFKPYPTPTASCHPTHHSIITITKFRKERRDPNAFKFIFWWSRPFSLFHLSSPISTSTFSYHPTQYTHIKAQQQYFIFIYLYINHFCYALNRSMNLCISSEHIQVPHYPDAEAKPLSFSQLVN